MHIVKVVSVVLGSGHRTSMKPSEAWEKEFHIDSVHDS